MWSNFTLICLRRSVSVLVPRQSAAPPLLRPAGPLVDRRIQAIAAIEAVRARHGVQIFSHHPCCVWRDAEPF